MSRFALYLSALVVAAVVAGVVIGKLSLDNAAALLVVLGLPSPLTALRREPPGLELPPVQPAGAETLRGPYRLPKAPPPRPGDLVLLLCLLPAFSTGCASWPAWRSALASCGVQVAPQGVQTGVALALHRGEGWEAALGDLVTIYGGCLIKAQVLAHAQGAGADPPQAADAVPMAALLGGDLTADSGRQVSREVAQQRAQAWLQGHR